MKQESLITQFHAYLLTEKLVSKNTFAAYQQDIGQFCSYLKDSHIELKDVTITELKQFLHYMHSQYLKARSIARKISALKVLFAYLHKRHNFTDVAKELKAPKIEQRLPKYLSEQEIESLFSALEKDDSAHGHRNKVMLYLLYSSGMRVSELINVKLSDVHADTNVISIAGKGNKERMIPVPEQIMTMIVEYINTSHKMFENKEKERIDILFPIKYGNRIKPLSRQAFWIILNDVWKKTGNERTISPHQLRHSLATHMLKQGAHLRSLQLLLGHENITTVQIYTHVEMSHVRKIYDKKHPRS